MQEVVQLLKNSFYEMSNVGIAMELCVAALLFLMLEKAKEKIDYVVYSVLLLVLVLNPLAYNNITTFWLFDDYWKMFLTATPMICVAYAFTELIVNSKKLWLRCLMGIACAFLVSMCANFEFKPLKLTWPENSLGVDREIREVDEVLKTADIPLRNVLAPREVLGSIREVNASISLLYSEELIQKKLAGDYQAESAAEANFTDVCMTIVAAPSAVANQLNVADMYGANCIILETEYDDQDLMEERGFIRLGFTENYVVYVRE